MLTPNETPRAAARSLDCGPDGTAGCRPSVSTTARKRTTVFRDITAVSDFIGRPPRSTGLRGKLTPAMTRHIRLQREAGRKDSTAD